MNRPLGNNDIRRAIRHYRERLNTLETQLPISNTHARNSQGEMTKGTTGQRRSKGEHSDPTANAAFADQARHDREHIGRILQAGGTLDIELAHLERITHDYTPTRTPAKTTPTRGTCPVCQLRLVAGNIAAGMCKDTCYQAWRRAGEPTRDTEPWRQFLDAYTASDNSDLTATTHTGVIPPRS